MARHFALAWRDFRVSLIDWRMWLLLGMNDIRQRYRRSRLGQFWITLAMATTIVTLGILYAYLLKVPLAEYLPYLGTSFVVWGLLSGIVLDSCTVFIGAEGYLRQVPMPKSVFVHRMLVRNVVTFLHNIIILPPLFIIFGVPLTWSILLVVVGIALILLNGIWVGLLLGTVCARFRDMPQIVASLVQVAYFLTPVMWRRAQLPPRIGWLSDLNPFQSFLDLVRDPLLGHMPPLVAWKVTGAVTIIGFIVAILFFSRFRARIVYWL
jgi:ABC-type polysaccharide/polyol phosphate export permease